MASDSGIEFDGKRHNFIIKEVVNEKKDRSEWDPEDMDEALRKMALKKMSANQAAEGYDFSKSTLRRVYKGVEDKVERFEEKHGGPGADGPETPFKEPSDQAADAIKEFFEPICEQSSLKEQTIDFLVVDDVRESGDIPSAVQLMQIILSGTTGVDNQRIAGRICQKYQRFIDSNDRIQQFLNQGEITLGQAAWAPALGLGAGMGPAAGPRGQTQLRSAGGQGLPGQQSAQQPDPEPADPFDELIELQEKKEKLEEALGVGGPNEHLLRLQEQLEHLQRQIEGEGAAPGGRGYEGFPENAPPSAQVAWLVKETEMDHDDAKEFVTENKSPEVLEYELERTKFDRRAELMDNMVNRVADTIEGVFGDWDKRLGDSIYENMRDGGESEEPRRTEPSQAGTEPSAPRDQAVAQTPDLEYEPCPECDGQMQVAGDRKLCQNMDCRHGTVPCDLCQQEGTVSYIELPPVGECDLALCGAEDCQNVLDVSTAVDGVVTCDECGWEGSPEDCPHEFVRCDECGHPRPVGRTEDELVEIRQEGVHMVGVAN